MAVEACATVTGKLGKVEKFISAGLFPCDTSKVYVEAETVVLFLSITIISESATPSNGSITLGKTSPSRALLFFTLPSVTTNLLVYTFIVELPPVLTIQ